MPNAIQTPQTVKGARSAFSVSAMLQWCWRPGAGSATPARPTLGPAPLQATEPPPLPATVQNASPSPVKRDPVDDVPDEIKRWQTYNAIALRRIAPCKAGFLLIEFMQRQGATGYFTVKEIDAWWRYMRQEEGLEYMSPSTVRCSLSGIRNVWIGLKRLYGPEFVAVQSRTGLERAVLYKIPTVDESAALLTAASRPNRKSTGATTGKRPANPQKRVLPGTFADDTGDRLSAAA